MFGVQLDPTPYRDFLHLMSIALLGTEVMTNWDQWQEGKAEFCPEQFIPIVDKPVVKAEETEPATFAQARAPSDTRRFNTMLNCEAPISYSGGQGFFN
ncbi:hypothetical protein GJ688_08830 [Heliobacillus mobilis]|uniref:Uncharacterized protein n=1 Tax=Heliobacterium mobile TaxID=28064 RepID=A0A6I3SK47_HELMO|nr:hypothetical protein [Heliobacterium mobile]MTV49082.1 hypothetical protein [Heliobacterium mobile]